MNCKHVTSASFVYELECCSMAREMGKLCLGTANSGLYLIASSTSFVRLDAMTAAGFRLGAAGAKSEYGADELCL